MGSRQIGLVTWSPTDDANSRFVHDLQGLTPYYSIYIAMDIKSVSYRKKFNNTKQIFSENVFDPCNVSFIYVILCKSIQSNCVDMYCIYSSAVRFELLVTVHMGLAYLMRDTCPTFSCLIYSKGFSDLQNVTMMMIGTKKPFQVGLGT